MDPAHKLKLRKVQLRNIAKLKHRICQQCGTKYKPTAFHQRFCCEDCWIEYSKERKKTGLLPEYVCQFCNKKTRLEFDPTNNINKLKDFICPHCGRKKT